MNKVPLAIAAAVMLAACSDTASRVTSLARVPDSPVRTVIGVDGNPAPSGADQVIVDTRASLQAATSLNQALALFRGNDHTPARGKSPGGLGWAFVTNFDGAGTDALRADWPATKKCTDQTNRIIDYLPDPLPQSLYVQWKTHFGRTSKDPNGNGAIDFYSIESDACKNASAYAMTVFRDVDDDGGDGAFKIWYAGRPATAQFEQDALGEDLAGGNQGWTFAPSSFGGKTVAFTIYLQAESRAKARDGAVRVWIDGKLYFEKTNIAFGTRAMSRFEFPGWRSGTNAESEYIWDVLAWAPAPVAPASVVVTPATKTLGVGDKVQLTAAAYDGQGNAMPAANVTWSTSDKKIANVDNDGTVTGTGQGTATITASFRGISGTAAITVTPPAPKVSLVVTLPNAALKVGDKIQAAVALKTPAGVVPATLPIVQWSSTNAAVATVSSSGLVTAVASGSAAIVAKVGDFSGQAALTVSAQTGMPMPGPGATILLDMRQSLQQATTIQQAFAPFASPFSGFVDRTDLRDSLGVNINGSGWSFTTNADGTGLHALRADWSVSTADQGLRVIQYFPNPQPTEVYAQWKGRLGKFAADPLANGVNDSYAMFPATQACKRALFARPDDKNRVDYTLSREIPEQTKVEMGDHNYSAFGDTTIWNPNIAVGKPAFTTTVHVKAASANGVNDGIFQLWIDGKLVLDRHDVPAEGEVIDRWSFPETCVLVPQPQSEYFWDILVWKP